MTAADRKQTREMIVDALAPFVKQIEGRDILMNATLNNIDGSVDKINTHLSNLNGKVAEHEKIVNTVGEERIKGCVQKGIIQEIRDNMVSRKAVYGAVFTGLGSLSVIIGIIYGVIRIFFSQT